MHTIDVMNHLHALDSALAACQRRAIAVDELCRIWNRYRRGLEQVDESDSEWVDELLLKMATRYGILGLVELRPDAGIEAPGEA